MRENEGISKVGQRKRLAGRGIIIFLCVVAGCMFFSRTIRNLTTPKVRFNTVGSGRLSKAETLTAFICFPGKEEIRFADAREYPLTITRVNVSANSTVKAGDVLLSAEVTDGDKKMDSLQEEYRKVNRDLAVLDGEHIRMQATTERTRRLSTYLDAMDALVEYKTTALSQGETEQSGKSWKDLQKAAEDARADFLATYEYSALMITDEIYQYVVKREELIQQIETCEENIVSLRKAESGSREIKAPYDGYVVTVDVKVGDSYNGLTTLCTMDKNVLLRAETGTMYESGTKGRIKTNRKTAETTVSAAGISKEGRKYVDFEMPEDLISAYGGIGTLAGENDIRVVVMQRSAASTSLIPASCLREDNNGTFVYVAAYSPAGLLDSGYRITRTSVRVIDRSDTQVSIEEDLYGVTVVDLEDRTLSEGMLVMER